MNQFISDGRLAGWRRFDKPRRFTGTDYGNQKGWERIPEQVQDVYEGVSTDACFYPVTLDDELPF